MSTIIERGAPRVQGPTTRTEPTQRLPARLRAFAGKAIAAATHFSSDLDRYFEASRQAVYVTERYLRMTDERLAGHGLTRRDVERRLRDIKCRDA